MLPVSELPRPSLDLNLDYLGPMVFISLYCDTPALVVSCLTSFELYRAQQGPLFVLPPLDVLAELISLCSAPTGPTRVWTAGPRHCTSVGEGEGHSGGRVSK